MAGSEVELSIVIPVRNGMPYLEETLASVIDQVTPDMEIIVRDNWSTDETAEFLGAVNHPQVHIFAADEPVSAGKNWTAVCAIATGTFTKLLCADDTVLPGGLARQLEAARSHPDATLIASRRQVIDGTGRVVIRALGLSGLIGERPGPAALKTAVMSGSNPFGEPSSVIFRTSALKRALPFTEQFPYLTDLDIYAKVLQHGNFVGLGTVDATFRLSPTSWSQSIGSSQLAEYRGWLNAVSDEGLVDISRAERALSDARGRSRFIARRAVTSTTGLLARRRG